MEKQSKTTTGWNSFITDQVNLMVASKPLRDISFAAILLGVTLNVLDCVSTGLLIFPTSENGSTTFTGLQTQAMSLYVMSTIISQLVMTLGGSLFPGAMGSMLIEVLPFLRNIASVIQKRLGEGHPGILPTVMAAYIMTSFLVGFVFILLGLLRCGKLVAYFPGTVLTGAIGAIGVSLFVLGLELTLPASSEHLSIHTTRHVLFDRTHLPLLFASVGIALFISISVRSALLSKMTRGCTEHALYVPLFCFAVAGIFWIAVAATKHASSDGLNDLRSIGWLFTIEKSHQTIKGLDWNYWALFDFSLVHWSAMTAAIQDILLLVVIAVISLPVFIPAMALTLNAPAYNMNWEFLGHGVSNLLAGAVGTVPNLIVLTNSKFFTLAGGGRIEALIVTAFSIALFFLSAFLLPYVPTILAATLVLFLGIELIIEALWDALWSLLLWEWAVVLSTVIACTFLGFAPGVGVGIAAALLLQLWWSVYECRPKISHMGKQPDSSFVEKRDPALGRASMSGTGSAYASSSSLEAQDARSSVKGESVVLSEEQLSKCEQKIVVIHLTGYVSFVMIPKIEDALQRATTTGQSVVVDFARASRAETCVAQMLTRQAGLFSKMAAPRTLAVAGFLPNSTLHADLKRGGLKTVEMDSSIAHLSASHLDDGEVPFYKSI
ncbi:hypothetical protein EK21DRAFT_107635 [Setomelanomma holmii]|uniref:STAS domain-containing protein n=1 Tax=Setomelanomma holmii TaxID=210430 RepID=A0A9P4HI47_9PLEO|nr:hypothetical protein EK21DRAFT_107635 [Setomelanomma holmii]